ncbi:MAG: hypothetical protein WDO18_05325 [Acidobacteriota bacterium]
MQVRDNCGAAISDATVVARFTNGDPPLTLDPDDAPTGVYAATWQARRCLQPDERHHQCAYVHVS